MPPYTGLQRVKASKHVESDDEPLSESESDVSRSDSWGSDLDRLHRGLTFSDYDSDGNVKPWKYSDEAPSSTESETFSDEDEAEEQDSKAAALADLTNISFGALASAQASLDNPHKRKRDIQADLQVDLKRTKRSPSPFQEAAERLAGKKKSISTPGSRSSKHAPTEVTSKKAVSRKRQVVVTPNVQARDPRFSNTTANQALNENKLEHDYKFLNDYRASERDELKAQIRKAKDPVMKERLTRDLKVMEDRERAKQRVEQERNVVREHKRAERGAVKEGKTPYFLKKAEVKKQVLVKKFEGMGEKQVEKVLEKRRKRKAQKERRNMPDERR